MISVLCANITMKNHIDWLDRRFTVSINERLINKNALEGTLFHKVGFENHTLPLEDLAARIRQGFAYCVELKGDRRKENFVSTSLLSVDVDGG